jgi:hypothetical protein
MRSMIMKSMKRLIAFWHNTYALKSHCNLHLWSILHVALHVLYIYISWYLNALQVYEHETVLEWLSVTVVGAALVAEQESVPFVQPCPQPA